MKINRVMCAWLVMSGVVCAHVYAAQTSEDGASAGGNPAAAPAQAQTAAVTEWSLVQGVDTVGDEGRGDWFKKKKILQQARKLYQELRGVVQKIVEAHGTLNSSYATTIVELSQKLAAIGVQPAEVEQKLQELNASIEKLAAQTQLTDIERKTLIEQQDSKNILQQFSLDLTFAFELQQGLNKGITIAAEQVQHCQMYEQKAWALYEAIDAALNDTMAEQMFEEMQTMYENIGLIGSYLEHDLNDYFKTSLPLLQEQEQKVSEQYARLQDRGIFKKEPSAQEQEAAQKAASATKAKKSSWWQSILSPFIWLWNWIMSFFRK